MSESIDQTRRKIIFSSLAASGLLMLAPKQLFGDEISDLLSDNHNQVVAVRLWPSSIYTRLTFEASNAISASYQLTDNLLKVEFANIQLNSILSDLSSKVVSDDPIVKSIKLNLVKDKVNVEITLKHPITVKVRSLEPITLGKTSYQYRFFIDMYQLSAIYNKDSSDSDDLIAFLIMQDDGINTKVEDKPSDIMSVLANKAPPVITKPSQATITSDKLILVMIDPGHGGEDPGAIGATGTREKDIVLDIAKNLYDLLNKDPRFSAQMTRTQDIFIPLGTRVAIAHKKKADIFVSIHADAFSVSTARGSSVFILSKGGATSSFAKWLAKTQNASDLLGGGIPSSKDLMLNRTLLDMVQTWSLKNSNILGSQILANLGKINHLHSNQVENAAFAVLKAPDIPSVLVESAFLSNPKEEEKLKTPDFRYEVAKSIYMGLQKYASKLFTQLACG